MTYTLKGIPNMAFCSLGFMTLEYSHISFIMYCVSNIKINELENQSFQWEQDEKQFIFIKFIVFHEIKKIKLL